MTIIIRIARKRLILTACLAALLSLTSCGGGSGGESTPGTTADNLPAPSPSGNEIAAPPDLGAAVVDQNIDLQPGAINSQRFLTRATFGPTIPSIDEFNTLGAEEWLIQQMAMPATRLADMLPSAQPRWGEYINSWFRIAIYAPDQLRQRVAFALSELLVISAKAGLGDEQPGVANYYDILSKHAFGNFRDLIEEVTLNPVMGEYLSMKGNHKPDPAKNIRPDENYARELLQLFTIGLVELNQDGSMQYDENGLPKPTYHQDTVEAFAHVFTGWHFANADDFRWPSTSDYISPMVPFEDYHDKSSKTLLNGFVVPAGQSAHEDLTMALDNIFHHKNVGPFIAKHMIQRLVTSNPSPDYISDVASVFNDNGDGVRGSLAHVVAAVLLHEEALFGAINLPETFGKLKEPILRVTSLWRAFTPESIHPEFNYAWSGNDIGQAPLNANSVFNFFTPAFSQPGKISEAGLVSPEFEIHDETSIITITNRILANSVWAHNYKYESRPNRILINIDREVAMMDDIEAFLDHLDRLLMGSSMSPELRDEARLLMNSRDYNMATSQKVVEAIFLLLSSPEAAVQL